MKTTLKILFLTIIVATFAACTSGGVKTEATSAKSIEETPFDMVYNVSTENSQLEWQGWKPTGTHNGTVNITSGTLMVKDEQLVGGSFEIDMTSISVLDIEDPEYNAKLRGHLTSADFFEVETFPTATFEITSVEPIENGSVDSSKEKGDVEPTHSITGNLTMKGITKSITINASLSKSSTKLIAQTNQFFIDRAEWNVQYGSKTFFDDLKDKFINDEMGITINLVAVPENQEMANK